MRRGRWRDRGRQARARSIRRRLGFGVVLGAEQLRGRLERVGDVVERHSRDVGDLHPEEAEGGRGGRVRHEVEELATDAEREQLRRQETQQEHSEGVSRQTGVASPVQVSAQGPAIEPVLGLLDCMWVDSGLEQDGTHEVSDRSRTC